MSRASLLARIQAELVGKAIQQLFPKQDIQYVPVTTTGDRSAEIGNHPPKSKDEFVREIETILLNEQADLAVHSLKDVPCNTPEELTLQTVLHREDPRDVLVGQTNVFSLEQSSRIGTSSPRRKALLKFRFKSNNVIHIRGNVDTRLKKLDRNEYDAILLAAAGLHRLNVRDRIDAYLDPYSFIPAPCQGTLAVQYTHNNMPVASTTSKLQHSRVDAAARCEREIVRALNADCTSPIGVYCEDLGDEYALHAIVLNSAGTESLELKMRGHDSNRLASNVANSLIRMGVEKLLHS